MNSGSSDSPRNYIGLQAEEIIDAETTWVNLGEQLDVGHDRQDDTYPKWHAGSDFEPMFLAVLWAKTEDESVTGLSDRLEDNPEIANVFGFNEDDIPHGDTFARAWRKRFEDLRDTIEISANAINEIAWKAGSKIGGHTGLDPKETSGSSKPTVQRLLRKHAKDVLDELEDVVFPALNIPRPENSIYSENDLLELMAVMGMNGEAANGGAETNGDRLAKQKDIALDDPFYEDGSRGETLLDAIHKLAIDEITDMVNRSAERTLSRIKPYAEFQDPVFLAIDITYVAYYGDREGMKWVSGTPDHIDYDWCHKFATATLVGEGIHLAVGMLPLGNPDHNDHEHYPGDTRKSLYRGDVVRDLLDIATKHVNPRMVFADRAFASADVITALEDRDLRYMIPAPRNDRTKPWLLRNVDTDAGLIATERDWPVYGAVKHGPANERVTTNLIGVPGDVDEDQYGFGSAPEYDTLDVKAEDMDAVPFYTNSYVDDETALDRRETYRKVKQYNMRGGIETSYKKIKEFAAYTTSKEFDVRNFHFGFAVLLYNAWLMVDFLVQVGLDVEFRSKPRITAKRFISFVRRRLDRLI